MVVIIGVGVTLFTTDSPPPVIPPATSFAPPAAMRDMGVGTDEEAFDPDAALSEEKLEKILKESGLMARERTTKKEKKSKDSGVHIDRI